MTVTSADVTAHFKAAGVLTPVTDPSLRSQAKMHLENVQLQRMAIHLNDIHSAFLRGNDTPIYPDLIITS